LRDPDRATAERLGVFAMDGPLAAGQPPDVRPLMSGRPFKEGSVPVRSVSSNAKRPDRFQPGRLRDDRSSAPFL